MVYTCDHHTQYIRAGQSSRVQDQSVLYRILSQPRLHNKTLLLLLLLKILLLIINKMIIYTLCRGDSDTKTQIGKGQRMKNDNASSNQGWIGKIQ